MNSGQENCTLKPPVAADPPFLSFFFFFFFLASSPPSAVLRLSPDERYFCRYDNLDDISAVS